MLARIIEPSTPAALTVSDNMAETFRRWKAGLDISRMFRMEITRLGTAHKAPEAEGLSIPAAIRISMAQFVRPSIIRLPIRPERVGTRLDRWADGDET